MKNIVKVLLKAPVLKLVSFFFNPIFLIWQIPIAWTKSLWMARVLAEGQLSRYIGFHPNNSLNSFFYRTQAINLDRFGRSGRSNLIGLGDFSLKSWFHISFISNYIYSYAGALTTLLGTLIWVFSHLVWLGDRGTIQVLIIVFVLFFSSTSYAMAFARQNYQILGWMWYPLGLYFLINDQWVLSSFCWLAAGSSGITPVFFSVIFVTIFSLKGESLLPLLTLVPTLVVWFLYLIPFLTDKEFYSSAGNIMKLIGLNKGKVRYQRKRGIGLDTFYFMLLYAIVCLVFYIGSHSFPVLSLICLIVFLVNQTLLRVADEQSLIILFVSLFTFEVLQADFNWISLLALWLAVNAHVNFLLIGKVSKGGIYDVSIHPPFDHFKIVSRLKLFLSNVKKGERIYFAFEDPNGNYSNIFDGYRVIIEPPLTVASELGIHLFPDWYAVAETNYEGAPQCWGRSLDEVKNNLTRWNAEYAIVYQATGTQLDNIWVNDFQEIATFDWHDILPILGGEPLWSGELPVPKWFLIKIKSEIYS